MEICRIVLSVTDILSVDKMDLIKYLVIHTGDDAYLSTLDDDDDRYLSLTRKYKPVYLTSEHDDLGPCAVICNRNHQVRARDMIINSPILEIEKDNYINNSICFLRPDEDEEDIINILLELKKFSHYSRMGDIDKMYIIGNNKMVVFKM